MTAVPKKKITSYTTGVARPSRQFRFAEEYLNWPEQLPVPAAVTDALGVLNQVVDRPAPAVPPLPSPAEFLGTGGDDRLAAHVLGGIVAARRGDARKEIAHVAAAELDAAIDGAADEMWASIDASFAAVFVSLPDVDLDLPGRITGADVGKVTAATRREIETAVLASAVVRAANGLSTTMVPRQPGQSEERVDATLCRYAVFDVATWQKFAAELNLYKRPKNGMTTLAWASACGAVPSIARDAQARRARLDTLNAALAVADARRIAAADPHHQQMLAIAKANAADFARDRERARAKA